MQKESHMGTVFLGVAVLVVFFLFLVGGFRTIIAQNQAFNLSKNAQKELSLSETRSRAERPSSYFFGPGTAAVTVVGFLDFQCPYSKQVYPTIKKLMAKYRGRSVSFIFRHFPIEPIHPAARSAARAAECAKEQNRFLEFHNALYDRQDEISLVSLPSFAVSAGVPDMVRFASCFSSQAGEGQINKDQSDAFTLGVSGTPTFYINGIKFEGAQDEQVFADIIDTALEGAPSTNAPAQKILPTSRIR